MKKSGIIIICLLLSAGTAACSGPAAANKSSAAEQSSEENGETVTVTLPAFLVQGQKEEDLKAAAQKEGYDSCVLN